MKSLKEFIKSTIEFNGNSVYSVAIANGYKNIRNLDSSNKIYNHPNGKFIRHNSRTDEWAHGDNDNIQTGVGGDALHDHLSG